MVGGSGEGVGNHLPTFDAEFKCAKIPNSHYGGGGGHELGGGGRLEANIQFWILSPNQLPTFWVITNFQSPLQNFKTSFQTNFFFIFRWSGGGGG